MIKTNMIKWRFITVGGFIMCLISLVIYDVLIPDPCYYHINNMNPMMHFFYDAGPASNGHPFPNSFNFIVAFLIGGILGYQIYRKVRYKIQS